MKCRICQAPVTEHVLSLGRTPLANSLLEKSALKKAEPVYPLELFRCGNCSLVMIDQFEDPGTVFSDYAYWSSFSDSWLRHVREYALEMIADRRLTPESFVIEIASNDGHLLKNFIEHGIPVLGIEPAKNIAGHANAHNVPTLDVFFGYGVALELAAEGKRADLIAANNVLAHVPDLHGFVAGIKTLLKPGGVFTAEFPHLLSLIEQTQFDTIYHEHLSYFSLHALRQLFREHGLRIHDARQLTTHGGSLRLYAVHAGTPGTEGSAVSRILQSEEDRGLFESETYVQFALRVQKIRRELVNFLQEARRTGRTVAGYGAPAKGNTLLNYCGIGTDLLPYTVDRSRHKQGKFLPGSHIPVEPVEVIRERRPDDILILPWNWKDEIIQQLAWARDWHARFVIPVPALHTYSGSHDQVFSAQA